MKVKHWNRLLNEVIDASCLSVFKKHWTVPSSVCFNNLISQEVVEQLDWMIFEGLFLFPSVFKCRTGKCEKKEKKKTPPFFIVTKAVYIITNIQTFSVAVHKKCLQHILYLNINTHIIF